jgi:pyruvate/2-oxoacid:ferredoxin oxidoreductase alpha subunit
MSTSVNTPNPNVDRTVKIFDQFYNYEQSVAVDEYDAVFSYFRSVFATNDAAGNFTVTLFRIADQTDIPVLDLLQQFEGQSAPELTFTMAFYLNKLRSNATLLGISQPTTPNYYVGRNVRQ